MYKTAYYNNASREQMVAFMKEQSFAILATCADEFPAVTQIPLKIEEADGTLLLSGHMMRGTDHFKALEKTGKVLALFTSPPAYIDANWYENTNSGSTVNYQTVHARGTIKFLDESGTRAAVKDITDRYVAPDSKAGFGQLTEEYISSMVKAIAGFVITVDSLESVWKLSQNKSAAEREKIIAELTARGSFGDLFIADQMKKESASNGS